jgi:hypothetical protein
MQPTPSGLTSGAIRSRKAVLQRREFGKLECIRGRGTSTASRRWASRLVYTPTATSASPAMRSVPSSITWCGPTRWRMRKFRRSWLLSIDPRAQLADSEGLLDTEAVLRLASDNSRSRPLCDTYLPELVAAKLTLVSGISRAHQCRPTRARNQGNQGIENPGVLEFHWSSTCDLPRGDHALGQGHRPIRRRHLGARHQK